MATRMVDEEGLEVGRAGGKDDFMGADGMALRAGQCHVDEALVSQQLTEDSQ